MEEADGGEVLSDDKWLISSWGGGQQELVSHNRCALGELNFNSKPITTNLTILPEKIFTPQRACGHCLQSRSQGATRVGKCRKYCHHGKLISLENIRFDVGKSKISLQEDCCLHPLEEEYF